MLLHFAFYTLIHPMGHNYFIGCNEDTRENGFTFYIYIVLSFHVLLSTDLVSLNFQRWMLLHFAFYTLLHPMGHNYFIGINEDSRANGFTFYIFIVLTFYVLLSTDWVSLKFQRWMLLHFALYTLLHLMGHNCSIRFNEVSRVNGFTFYI